MEDNKTISQEELEQLMRDAISGNEGAQCKLGFCYQNGKGVEEDIEKAIFWYQKAVEQNDKVAQLALGRIYLLEENDEAWEKGISLITQSAEQGLALAMSELGFEYYYRGKTEDKYNEQAVYWLTKAADLDDASSQRWLGQCYLNGCGVEKDESGRCNVN